MKRILFVHSGNNWIRGSERVLLDIITGLDPSRFSAVVWSNSHALAEEAARLGVKTYTDTFPILLESTWDIRKYWRLVQKGQELLVQHKIDLIHCNGASPVQWMIAAGRRLRVPVLAHLHHPPLTVDRLRYRLHSAALVVGVSQACIAELLKDGLEPRRSRVIYNGIDLNRASEELRLAVRVETVIPTVMFLGSLIPRKGLDILLKACSELAQQGQAFRLLIVGDGPCRSEYRQMVEALRLNPMVEFAGERSDALKIMARDADIFVLPSRMEALPISLLEAGSLRKASVATTVGGVPEIISDGLTGLLVAPDNPSALSDALSKLLQDRRLRDRLGNQLREVIEKRFSLSTMLWEFQSEYDRLTTMDWMKQRTNKMRLAMKMTSRASALAYKRFSVAGK